MNIVLEGAQLACRVEGFQELLFDILSNYPAVECLTVEPSCMDGLEAAALMAVMEQFCQVYPERCIRLEAKALSHIEKPCLICDLTELDWNA